MSRVVGGRFAGVPLWTGTLDAATTTVLDDARRTTSRSFRLVNAYSLYCARKDRAYAAVLRGEGVNFIDGRPLAWLIARRHRRGAVEQVRGPTLFERCLDAGRAQSYRHFLLGGSPELLSTLGVALTERYPGLVVAGTFAPPFRAFTAEDRNAFRAEIERARPDIVWVGLGTPRQDIEAAELTATLGLTSVAVGAAFDFSAGLKAEAPPLLRASGLEWVFRLLSEPSRLWRRYLYGNAYFLYRVAYEGIVGLLRR
jgi:N-acetylglucosaminyldiphosphoundecaprenol N-acetyl-beta-D-mannosaminyltransferase